MPAVINDGSVFTNPARFADDANWHEVVASIRRTEPVFRVDVDGFPPYWALTRHADVSEIEKRHDIFKNTMRVEVLSLKAEAMADQPGGAIETLVHMDDPKHRKFKGLTSGWFKPAVLRANMAEKVDALCEEFIERMAGLGGECDFVADIARPLPLRVIMGILGVPPQDEPLMLDLTQRIMGPADPDYQLTGDAAEDHARTVAEVFGYFQVLAQARREQPTQDLATVIANGTIDGERDLCPLLVFLCGTGARFITGQLIAVDGGMRMLGA